MQTAFWNGSLDWNSLHIDSNFILACSKESTWQYVSRPEAKPLSEPMMVKFTELQAITIHVRNANLLTLTTMSLMSKQYGIYRYDEFSQ